MELQLSYCYDDEYVASKWNCEQFCIRRDGTGMMVVYHIHISCVSEEILYSCKIYHIPHKTIYVYLKKHKISQCLDKWYKTPYRIFENYFNEFRMFPDEDCDYIKIELKIYG